MTKPKSTLSHNLYTQHGRVTITGAGETIYWFADDLMFILEEASRAIKETHEDRKYRDLVLPQVENIYNAISALHKRADTFIMKGR